ncbi:mediator of RNA polymerase II transcription subunit 4 [Setomelanomma holmii]|uniref:Mediator of RNA polymerase II transcription subunit 4 n=1 Tax=Setomelanomma holmii TaxID=210430 RepID=A0A9P4H2T7_9PLEO|nr:mediator of RNA polymerase II transcription subunit 4 [Setomelanomma holmii]
MESVLSSQFERVEKALSTLVDSIAAYNPSPQAALDLVAADDELSQGLDQLAWHQANHARIQSLRTEAESLEEQLKTSVASLASLRHELFDTPATTFPTESRPVHCDELLQFAKNISQHTVPPTYRERAPQASTEEDKEKEDAASSGAPTNVMNTPANVDLMDITKGTPEGPKEGHTTSAANLKITAEEEEWLRKLHDSKIAWFPWPSDDKIRTGNLYKLMYWQAKNKDVDDFDIYAHEEKERIKRLPEDERPPATPQAEAESKALPAQAHAEPSEVQRTHVPRPAPAPKIFDAFDDLDD